MNAALKDQIMMQTEASGETWRWKQRDALEVLQVKDVYFDIIETVSGVICCSGENEGEIEARGKVVVEARLPQEASPRVGFRMKSPNEGKVRDIGVH
jgi:hypothetical protein